MAATLETLLAEARQVIPEQRPQELKRRIDAGTRSARISRARGPSGAARE